MKNVTLHFDCGNSANPSTDCGLEKCGSKICAKNQSSFSQTGALDPAEIDLEPGHDEPELSFRDPKCEGQHMHYLIAE